MPIPMLIPTLFPMQLHRPAAIAIALLVAGVVALWLAQAAVDDRRSTLHQARSARQQALDLVQHTEHENAAIRHTAARLAAVSLTPITERAADPIASLRHLHGDPRLFGFAVHAQGAARELAEGDDMPLIRLQALRLDIDLLHEEGLTALLHALARAENAIAIPLGCEIERLVPPTIAATPSASASSTPGLHARCELDWLTLHPRPAPRS